MTRLAKGLSEVGHAVLRFGLTGSGERPGEFATTHLATTSGISPLLRPR